MKKTDSTVHPVTSSLMDFIPQFILHIDPIVHHTEHEGTPNHGKSDQGDHDAPLHPGSKPGTYQ
jgi:hypothetical protein